MLIQKWTSEVERNTKSEGKLFSQAKWMIHKAQNTITY